LRLQNQLQEQMQERPARDAGRIANGVPRYALCRCCNYLCRSGNGLVMDVAAPPQSNQNISPFAAAGVVF
jgi:hypothetical protein